MKKHIETNFKKFFVTNENKIKFNDINDEVKKNELIKELTEKRNKLYKEFNEIING